MPATNERDRRRPLPDLRARGNELRDNEAEIREALQQARDLVELAQGEDRDLTPAEQREFDRLSGRARSLRSNSDRLRQLLDDEHAELSRTIGNNPQGESGDPVERGGSFTDSDGRRQVTLFRSFGDQLLSIVEAGRPGGQTDPRLHQVQQLAASGLNEGISSEGGFLIETQFAREILRRAYDTGEVAKRCRPFPVGSGANGISLPRVDEISRATGSRWGGVRVYRVAEAATVAASKPTFGRLSLELSKLMGLCYVTDELLADAVSLGNFVSLAFSEEISFVLDNEIIRGTGAGECLGVLNSDATVTVDAEAGPQTPDTIVTQNVVKMWSRMWGRSRRNAVWFINQDVEPSLYTMSLTVGTGGAPVFLPGGGLSEQPYSTLFGRPVVPIEQCSTLGDKGDVILFDGSQYILADKAPRADISMHVRFVYDETAFRFTYRVNGAPAWKTALTPAQGTNSLSPFVTLAAR